MANKEKLLASAQKHLKKKALPKAIKDFAKVVEIDPNDMRSRQKLAELYARTGKSAEAFEQYETVAKYFSGNGFYLKSIAIYRQMQRLDSSQISIHMRLAELNEKQGLVGNAMTEYRALISHYEKNDMIADSIRVLEKMQELDPENLGIQIKLAEVLINNSQVAEGREYFNSVLAVLNERQDFDRLLKIYKKFIPLLPEDDDVLRGLASTLLAKGELEKGLGLLQNLLRDNPDDLNLLRQLATTYQDLNDQKNRRLTYQQILKLDSSDLDMREALVHCCLDSQQFKQALSELEEWKESFQKADRLEILKGFYETLKENLPENKTVLLTLDSIYELTGDGDKILDIISSSEDDSPYAVEEETVSDSLLETASEDYDDEQILDLEEFDVSDSDSIEDLAIEPLDGPEEPPVGAEEDIIELEISDALQVEVVEEDSLDLSFDLGEELAGIVPERNLQAELEEAEFYLQQGLLDEAERVCRELLQQNPGADECQQKLDEILARRDGVDNESDPSSELFDLAAEVLEEGFSDLALESLDNILSDDASNLDDLLDISEESPVFRTDVDDQIAADDMESHYNLGIAYREMGLFDDAISEFEKAQADPSRFVDCLTLRALCFADKGEFEKSEEAYKKALASTSVDDIQHLSLHYELGLLYENFQRPEDALGCYQLVAESDPQFRDIEKKIATLNGDAETPRDSGASKDRISFL